MDIWNIEYLWSLKYKKVCTIKLHKYSVYKILYWCEDSILFFSKAKIWNEPLVIHRVNNSWFALTLPCTCFYLQSLKIDFFCLNLNLIFIFNLTIDKWKTCISGPRGYSFIFAKYLTIRLTIIEIWNLYLYKIFNKILYY